MKSRLYKLVGVLISVLFVYLAVRKVDFSESVQVLGTVQFGWLLAATMVYLSAFPIRALRWRQILRHQKALSFGEVIVPLLVGQAANNVLPARAGEIYRAHFLGRRALMSRSGAMGSIVVERTFDGLILVCLIVLVLFLFPQTQFLGGVAMATGLVFVTLMASLLFYSFTVDRTQRVIDRWLGMMPQKPRELIGHRLEAFLQGIRGVSTLGEYLEAGAYTVLILALEAGAIVIVVVSFGVTLPLSGYLLLFALSALSTTLPSGPGYIGPYQYAFVLALSVFAISEETALAISVAAQLALLGSATVIGLALHCVEQLRTGLSFPSTDKLGLRNDPTKGKKIAK